MFSLLSMNYVWAQHTWLPTPDYIDHLQKVETRNSFTYPAIDLNFRSIQPSRLTTVYQQVCDFRDLLSLKGPTYDLQNSKKKKKKTSPVIFICHLQAVLTGSGPVSSILRP